MQTILLTVILAAVITIAIFTLFLWPSLRRRRNPDHALYGNLTSADSIKESDEMPVLYLRPFTVAGEDERPLPADGFALPNVEADMITRLRRVAPVVTIGFPGERFMRGYGMVRAQCPRDGWEEFIEDWMQRSRLLVVVVSPTPGVVWEISAILRHGYLPRTLFVVNEQMGEPEELLTWLRHQLRGQGDDIDPDVGASCVIGFDRERKPVVVRENLGYGDARRVEALDEALQRWEQTHSGDVPGSREEAGDEKQE